MSRMSRKARRFAELRPIPIIPDLWRIVLEYSSYTDRKGWNYKEDTGLIYENINITKRSLRVSKDIKRMINITLIANHVRLNQYLPNLRTLICGSYFYHRRKDYYSWGGYNTELPLNLTPNLTSLHLGPYYNKPLMLHFVPNLRRLNLGSDFNQELDLRTNIHLHTLDLGHNFEQGLVLPTTNAITTLYTGNLFCMDLIPHMPTLTSLYLGPILNQPLDLSGVPELKELHLGELFNRPLVLRTNINLQILDTGDSFNRVLVLRTNVHLHTLNLDQRFTKSIYLKYTPLLYSKCISNYVIVEELDTCSNLTIRCR